MKGLLRALSTGILAIAVAGAGFPSVLVANAANTPPVITSITITPDPANEGDVLRVDVTFSDVDPDVESVSILWSDMVTGAPITLTGGGVVSFFQERRVFDDFPTNTPVDTLQVTVTINDGVSQARGTASVTMRNVAPVFTAFTVTPAEILPNQSVTAAGSFSDPSTGDSFTLAVDWGDGSAASGQTFRSTAAKVFSFPHVYDRGGPFTVTATLWDDDMPVGVVAPVVTRALVVVTSPNTPPSDLRVTAGAAFEGGTTTFTVNFVDPDIADTHTASIVWGDDGSTVESFDGAAGVNPLRPTHVYRDSGSYDATFTVADGSASTPPVTIAVSVANVAPTVTSLVLTPSSIVEQDSVTAAVTFADPGMSDTLTVTVSWGDGTSWSSGALAAGSTSTSAAHQYLAARSFTITATVTDSDGAVSAPMSKTLDVRARNRAPSGLTLTASSPTAGSAATLTGSFTDLDTTDTHTVSVAWGDTSTGTLLPLGPGAGSFSATHTYAASGTYHVSVTVTDPAGLSTSAAVDLVVQKQKEKNECDWLVALEQRYAWLNDHDTHGLLARVLALFNSRFGCDDDGDHGGGDQHGDMRGQVTASTHAVKQSDARDDRSRRTER